MSKLHFELLSGNHMAVLKLLSKYARYGLLGGGTALMLQIANRRSYDFDIFLPKAVSRKFLYLIKQQFHTIEILVDTGDELSFISRPHKIKVSFIFYPFQHRYRVIQTPYVSLFNWKDIGLDKAHTIGRRGEWRDYVDLYCIIKQGFSLKNIIRGARKKFGDSFSEKLFLSQLAYLGDIQDFTIDTLAGKEYPKRELEQFFEHEVREYKNEVLFP